MPFQRLNKLQVLQDVKFDFGGANSNPKKAAHLIAKILYVLGKGEKFSDNEAQDIFVQSTMLFMSPDLKLRRMLYLIIKELSETSEEAYMAVNSLSNDMTKGELRANAIRALRCVADLSTFNALDRHLEQCIVDKDPSISSAALVSALHLADINPEAVRRWQTKIQSAMMSSSHMVQYHALAVMYKLKYNDSLAISKLTSESTSSFRSPLAHSLLIRYATRILQASQSVETDRGNALLKYLNTCLTYKNEMISFEAAKAICSLTFLTPAQITPAVNALHVLLINYSNRSVHKFAAIRILNQLSDRHPDLVQICQDEISDMIDDSNKNIATLAITTLLKSGNLTSIENLLKQITSFMSSIADDFKIFVVDAMRLLVQKYPTKHISVIKFLNEVLRGEGGFDFKRMIAETMITIIKQQDEIENGDPEVKESGISYLCDFIEDCEYTILLQKILYFLGEEGPKTKNPSQCIRYIYNRIILENPPVRATAVVTLSKFAISVPKLTSSILVLLKRSLQDTDDEVRDRAVACIESLKDQDLATYVLSEEANDDIDAVNMERSLLNYINGNLQSEFSLSMVTQVVSTEKKVDKPLEALTSQPVASQIQQELFKPSKLFAKVPFLKKLGKPFKSSEIISLTESDSDYVVNGVKHIFPTFIVFQFLVRNNVEEHILEDVDITLGELSEAEGLDADGIKVISPSKPIRFQQSENILVCIPREEGSHPTGDFPVSMNFKIRIVDVETKEEEEDVDEDDIDLETIRLSMGDYMNDEVAEFKPLWEEIGDANETKEVVEFSRTDSLQESLLRVETLLGLSSLVSTQVPEGKSLHELFFIGKLDTSAIALIAASMKEEKKGGILLLLKVRSTDETLREKIIQSVTQ